MILVVAWIIAIWFTIEGILLAVLWWRWTQEEARAAERRRRNRMWVVR